MSTVDDEKDNNQVVIDELVDEKKNDDNNIENDLKYCSLMELYNLVQQQRITVIDIRSKQQYKKCHIQWSVNIDEPMKLNAFNDDIGANILIYGDIKCTTNDTINHLHKIAQKQSDHKSFVVFNG